MEPVLLHSPFLVEVPANKDFAQQTNWIGQCLGFNGGGAHLPARFIGCHVGYSCIPGWGVHWLDNMG